MTPGSRVVLTRSGVGKFIMMFKSKTGCLEEWKLSFSKEGLTMVVLLVVLV
jgi:hypothetical protein